MNFPNKKYSIIYADPPWEYRAWTAKDGHKSASAHYETMKIKDICALPVADLAAKECTLFMWATLPNLPNVFKVMAAWEFKYKTTAFTWVKVYKSGKPRIGQGYWTRANAEICLLATRGHPRRINDKVSQVIIEPIREHSRKPDTARDRIVELMGNLPRIELFARDIFPGWEAWGNEVKHDGRTDPAPGELSNWG